MTTVRELHNQAMQLAQLALIARHSGKYDEAVAYARQTYVLEQQAADQVPDAPSSEPTRSILYRSAASLAYQAQELRIAQRLIIKGLAGYPPPNIEQELNLLYDQVRLGSSFDPHNTMDTGERKESGHDQHQPSGEEFQPIIIDGILDYASSRNPDNEIVGLSAANGKKYDVTVREGVEKIVKSYFKQPVIITGVYSEIKNLIYLSKIEAVE